MEIEEEEKDTDNEYKAAKEDKDEELKDYKLTEKFLLEYGEEIMKLWKFDNKKEENNELNMFDVIKKDDRREN